MSEKKIDLKRFLLISVFFSLFLIGTLLIFTTPNSIKITYSQTVETEDGVSVSFNVFEPKNGDDDMSAILIGHGVMCNKEMLKGYAIELAAAGFVAVPFDFRGHGQSSGELTRGELIEDVKAVKSYLKSRGDIDMDNLGYIGYSMGGTPGWEIVNDDDSFKCFVGIGTYIPSEDRNEDLIIEANSGRYLNVLMILAKYDQAFTLEGIKQGVAERVDIKTSDVKVNKLYGEFDDGDATKIYLDENSDHLTTAWDEDFIREARNWVKNTFLDVDSVDGTLYVNIRALILILQVIGGFGLFFLIIEPLSNLITKHKEDETLKIELEQESLPSLSKKIIFYSLAFSIPGMIIMILLLGFLPLSLAGAMLTLLFGQVFGMIILLWRLSKKNDSLLKEIVKTPFSISKENIMRQIILGIILAVGLYLIIYISFGLNYLGMAPSLHKIPWMPIYFIIALLMFVIFGIVFQMILQSKIENGLIGVFKTAGLSFGFLMIYLCIFILGSCIAMGNFFLAIALILIAPMLLLTVFVSAQIYKKSGNIIAGSITNTLIIVCIISTLSPYMNMITVVLWFV